MSAPVKPKDNFTLEQYPAVLEHADERLELWNGQIVNTGWAEFYHSLIANNFKDALTAQLSRDCRAIIETPVAVDEFNAHIPDLVVYCGKPQLRSISSLKSVLTNPVLIIEVLSRTTKPLDRGFKFENYRKIPSLKEYIPVAQNEYWVDQFVLHNGRWIQTVYNDPVVSIKVSSIEGDIQLSELYRDVVFQNQNT